MKKNYKNELSNNLNEILIGLLLGDLSVQQRKQTHNARLYFRQGLINKEYLLELYNIFKDYCNKEPILQSYYDKRVNKTYNSIFFNTRSLSCFNCYREIFYLNGIKIVPSNIEELLTAKGLAYWIMDDGTKDGNGLIICTNSFTKEEVELLIYVLKNKFNLDCNIRYSKGFKIYIKVKSMNDLRKLVLPYFYTSMLYKLAV